MALEGFVVLPQYITSLPPSGAQSVCDIDVKKRFLTFLFLSRFLRFLTFFIFRTFFKIKNVESLFSMQANSEISVLHLTSDRLNCSGLLLLSTIFVACWAYYMRVGIKLFCSAENYC